MKGFAPLKTNFARVFQPNWFPPKTQKLQAHHAMLTDFYFLLWEARSKFENCLSGYRGYRVIASVTAAEGAVLRNTTVARRFVQM